MTLPQPRFRCTETVSSDNTKTSNFLVFIFPVIKPSSIYQRSNETFRIGTAGRWEQNKESSDD